MAAIDRVFARPQIASLRSAVLFGAVGAGALAAGLGLVFSGLGRESWMLVGATFLGLALGRLQQLRRALAKGASSVEKSSELAVEASPPLAAEPVSSSESPAPRLGQLAVLYGTLRGLSAFLEKAGAEAGAEAISDYLTLAAARVRASAGRFERAPGGAFVASWDAFADGAAAVRPAAECASFLIEDFSRLNETRKLDGQRPLAQGLALHLGQGLLARAGAAGEASLGAFGEPLQCARALEALGAAAGRELVVSHDVLSAAGDALVGSLLGEAKLTQDTGLTAYYGVFCSEEPSRAIRARQGPRWLVNNGSQIVGPVTAREIAAMLFAQEIDFDSECWAEENGRPSQVGRAGIFSATDPSEEGSEGAEAGKHLWIYDGEQVHGPVSEGFLRTAVACEALGDHVFVCAGSTVQGWRPIAGYLASVTAPGSGAEPAKAAA